MKNNLSDFLLGFIINLSGIFLCSGSLRILTESTKYTPLKTIVIAIVILLVSLPIMYLGAMKMEFKVVDEE